MKRLYKCLLILLALGLAGCSSKECDCACTTSESDIVDEATTTINYEDYGYILHYDPDNPYEYGYKFVHHNEDEYVFTCYVGRNVMDEAKYSPETYKEVLEIIERSNLRLKLTYDENGREVENPTDVVEIVTTVDHKQVFYICDFTEELENKFLSMIE